MNKLRLYPVLVALLTLSWTLPAVAVSPEALKNGIPSLAPMLQQVTPAVVSIRVTKTASSSNDFSINGQQLPEELRRYFENLPGLNGDANGQRPYARGAGCEAASWYLTL